MVHHNVFRVEDLRWSESGPAVKKSGVSALHEQVRAKHTLSAPQLLYNLISVPRHKPLVFNGDSNNSHQALLPYPHSTPTRECVFYVPRVSFCKDTSNLASVTLWLTISDL